ncbi:hypothetical protein FKP32DRAFT_1589097 [Trametes sanguinea]|nr:hypothetical protein FKP32DRAFT_1589097 [Trametes sanguinea]
MSTNSIATHPAVETQPAPWTVQAEAWWFITSLGHRPERGETLPLNYFPSQETQLYRASTEQGAFLGGRGSITLIRYSHSPIGAFDELCIIPGEFTNPFETPSHRVTRGYVSSPQAVVNGRHNWGLPRELAEFVFTPSLDHPDATEVRVYPAISFSSMPIEYASSPCFAALIKPVSWLPAIPTSLPRVRLCQPPLESSPGPSLDGLVGVPKWHLTDCSDGKGRARPFRFVPLLPPEELSSPDARGKGAPAERKQRLADGVGFPAVDPYSIGVHWTELSMTLPQAIPLAGL